MRILPRYISILALKICLAIIYIYRKFEKQISYHLFEDKTYNTSSGNSIHKNKSKFGTIWEVVIDTHFYIAIMKIKHTHKQRIDKRTRFWLIISWTKEQTKEE